MCVCVWVHACHQLPRLWPYFLYNNELHVIIDLRSFFFFFLKLKAQDEEISRQRENMEEYVKYLEELFVSIK